MTTESDKPESDEPKLDKTGAVLLPATPLMKKVAQFATDKEKMERVFTPDEIQEILNKKANHEEITKEEKERLSRHTRDVKRWVKNRAAGEYGKIFIYPSYTSESGAVWYKMIDFSAIYFVRFLADRMGMNVHLYPDTDNYVKSDCAASITNIHKVVDAFMKLGGKNVETTMTGVYILTLAKPMTAEDYGLMLRSEVEKRERVNNMLRPVAMAPLTHKFYLDLLGQLGPKLCHLEKRLYFSIGEMMMKTLNDVLRIYYLYSDGFLTAGKAGLTLISHLDSLKAGLAVLQELGAWHNPATAAMLGELLIRLREQILRDFKIKVGKSKEDNSKAAKLKTEGSR